MAMSNDDTKGREQLDKQMSETKREFQASTMRIAPRFRCHFEYLSRKSSEKSIPPSRIGLFWRRKLQIFTSTRFVTEIAVHSSLKKPAKIDSIAPTNLLFAHAFPRLELPIASADCLVGTLSGSLATLTSAIDFLSHLSPDFN